MLCRVMRVDRRGYYRWYQRRSMSVSLFRQKRNQQAVLVKALFEQAKAKVGSRSLVSLLQQRDQPIGRYRVRRLMHEQNLVCRVRRLRKQGAEPSNADLVLAKHTCTPSHINALWVTDITYIKTTQGWRYLSVVLDAYSRRIISHQLNRHMTAELVVATLHQAACQRPSRTRDTIIHSDRGSQYTSHAWHKAFKQLGLVGSMSGKGNCYDNAIMERFFGTLKDALVVDEVLVSPETMRQTINSWIVQYNHSRGHSSLGGLTPAAFESSQFKQAA